MSDLNKIQPESDLNSKDIITNDQDSNKIDI